MHVYHCTLPTHPRTGLRAVGIVKGRPVWPILGGDDSGDAAAQAAAKAAADAAAANYQAPASQADLDRIVEQRLSRERAKFADYDEMKTKAARADQLEADLGSEADKLAKKARDEERAKADSEWTPRVVKAEFKAAAKGVLTDDQLSALLEDLNLSKYVTDKGEADDEKIAKKVAALAPTGAGQGKQTPRPLGQGSQRAANAKPGEQGQSMADKRFGDKKRSNQQ